MVKPRVMIGAGGTATAFGIARTLRANWSDALEIVVADVKPKRLVASATFADGYRQSPLVADPGYPAWLADTLRDLPATLYVPLIDEDIRIAAELSEAGPSQTWRTAAPPLESARVCWDKLETYEWLRERGLPTAETWAIADAPRRETGLVAKSRHGQGSIGFRRLSGAAELNALATSGEDLVVQAACEPPEMTIDAFLSQDGAAFRAICRERLEVKAGVCTQARVFESEQLSELAERVARGLGLHGGSCMQVMRGGGGGWRLTDVNARPGAGGRLSTAAGVDILGAVYADLLGLPFDRERNLGALSADVYVVRGFDEYVIT